MDKYTSGRPFGGSVSVLWAAWRGQVVGKGPSAWPPVMITLGRESEVSRAMKAFCPLLRCEKILPVAAEQKSGIVVDGTHVQKPKTPYF